MIASLACVQLDMPALYQQEGHTPFEALQERCNAAEADAAATTAVDAVSGIVWTPSMRRMYTLLARSGHARRSSISSCKN